MGFFDKFKKENNDFPAASKAMGNELIGLYSKEVNLPFENTTELERQVLAVYFFGMSNGMMQQMKLKNTPDEIAEIIKNNLVDVFGYSSEQARQFFDNMVSDLQSKDPQNTQYVIIHRGLEGYFAWEKGQKVNVIKDVSQIIGALNG